MVDEAMVIYSQSKLDLACSILSLVSSREVAAYLFSRGRYALVYDVLLLERHPKRQDTINGCVEYDCAGCVVLGAVPAELVVPQEAQRGNGKGAVA